MAVGVTRDFSLGHMHYPSKEGAWGTAMRALLEVGSGRFGSCIWNLLCSR